METAKKRKTQTAELQCSSWVKKGEKVNVAAIFGLRSLCMEMAGDIIPVCSYHHDIFTRLNQFSKQDDNILQ